MEIVLFVFTKEKVYLKSSNNSLIEKMIESFLFGKVAKFLSDDFTPRSEEQDSSV